MKRTPLSICAELQEGFSRDIKGEENQELIRELNLSTNRFLEGLGRCNLTSKVRGKEYFGFKYKGKISRAVNSVLYEEYVKKWNGVDKAITTKGQRGSDSETITRVLYSSAIAFCCYVDLTKERDQKTPGIFF